MKKIFVILIIILVLILLVCVFMFFPGRATSPKTEISINKIQSSYGASENIILGGNAKANADIVLFFAGKIGMIKANGNGEWLANLGKMPAGNYAFEAMADTSKTKNSVVSAEISVVNAKPLISYLQNVFFAGLTAYFANNIATVNLIPENSPQVLQGKWKLLK